MYDVGALGSKIHWFSIQFNEDEWEKLKITKSSRYIYMYGISIYVRYTIADENFEPCAEFDFGRAVLVSSRTYRCIRISSTIDSGLTALHTLKVGC